MVYIHTHTHHGSKTFLAVLLFISLGSTYCICVCPKQMQGRYVYILSMHKEKTKNKGHWKNHKDQDHCFWTAHLSGILKFKSKRNHAMIPLLTLSNEVVWTTTPTVCCGQTVDRVAMHTLNAVTDLLILLGAWEMKTFPKEDLFN